MILQSKSVLPTTPGGEVFPDISPVTGEVIAEFPAWQPDEAIDLVNTANIAQPQWGNLPFSDRRRILLNAADLLEKAIDDHVATMALEVGASRPWAEMNVHEAAATLREAAAFTSTPHGEILPSSEPGSTNHSMRGPAGVTLSIVPWNAPLILAARSSMISLALGNAVIIRPSEEAPISAGHLLANTLIEAGVPPEVIPVVTTAPGQGRHLINALISEPAVRRVAFIGSTPVGQSIASKAGSALTPSVMELGGKNVTIVRDDADLEKWAPILAFSGFANTGQVCMCTDRVLVHHSRFDEAVERLGHIATNMIVGDPRDPNTDLGPLINDTAADHFAELVDDAQRNGARIVTGGTRNGRYAQPTVLAEVGTSCRFDTEEGFSPIISVTPFHDDADAIAKANQGNFGLIAAVISRNNDAAYQIARRIRAGAVHVNGPSVGDEPHVPFGGLGMSGMGRLGGQESVRFFTEQRTYYLHG